MNDLHALNSSECALHFDELPRGQGGAGLLQCCILVNEEMPCGF